MTEDVSLNKDLNKDPMLKTRLVYRLVDCRCCHQLRNVSGIRTSILASEARKLRSDENPICNVCGGKCLE